MKKALKVLSLFVFVWLGGCATYGASMNTTIADLKQGNYAASEENLKKAIKPDGDDRLLYRLELAVIKHLAGEFEASNALLEEANQIAEDLETTRVSENLSAYMTNPRQGPYAGADFEKVFINYYKALNYFGLAQLAPDRAARLDALEGARIETQRLIIRLNDLNERKGNYKPEGEEEGLFATVLKIFSLLSGNLVDMKALEYRDDAMAHYLSGVTFEMNGEYDDARISYVKAAQSYERGYAKQFRLDNDITRQAWFDAARMMRTTGGFDKEWKDIAQKKLTKEQRDELNKWNKNKAQIIVLEHKGLAPHRKEMNLVLSINAEKQAMELQPWGMTSDVNALAWFYILYADKNILDTLANFLDASDVAFQFSSFTKTVSLGPLWDTANQIGLLEAINPMARITVPYYDPVKPLPTSTLTVDGQKMTMYKSSNPGLMAVQEQILKSGTDINLALGRAAMKAFAADQLKHAGGYGGLLSMVGKVAASASDAAETRGWLLLPQDIRVRRAIVEPGEHNVELASQMPDGPQYNQHKVDLQPGEISLWRVRVLPSHESADKN